MKKIFLSMACSFVALYGHAQANYSIKNIPDSLLKDADVVKRVDETVFRVKGPDKIVEYNKVAYTILNENAEGFGYIVQHYDKMIDIKQFDATLFDAAGVKIKSVKKAEVKDESTVSGMTLMADNRVKWFNFFRKEYPYTVEFVTETESSNTMFFPTWLPVGTEKMGVEKSSLIVYYPKDYTMRYKLLGGATDAKKSASSNENILTWEYHNIKPIKKEPFSISWYDLSPTVLLAPSNFSVEGYEGDMNSWESFGKFRLKLNEGRDKLPESIKADIQQLIAPLQSDKEKIYAIYRYLQENTRYISVQLGLGGWQPFEASYVASKKYGDCKALSNYTTALLKEAGIESYYSVIKAGEGVNNKWFLPDFTNNSFNHIIVCVPNHGDTVWLECTSQNQYPGYMGDFTDNRYAFLITPEGGKIAKTPKYGLNENTQVRKLKAVVDEQGNAKMHVQTIYQAQQQDNLYSMVKVLSKDKVNEVLKANLDLPNYELVNYDYKPALQKYPVMDETLDIDALKYAQVSGKRLFIIPNVMSKASFKPVADSNRKYPIRFDYEYRDIDTATIEIPAGYKPESLPKDQEIKSDFGLYKVAVKIEGNKITYTRMIERYSGVFPASKYDELVKFWEQVYKSDRAKVVMVKEAAQ